MYLICTTTHGYSPQKKFIAYQVLKLINTACNGGNSSISTETACRKISQKKGIKHGRKNPHYYR